MSTARKLILGISLFLVAITTFINIKQNTETSINNNSDSLTIKFLQTRKYSGSDIVVEETLPPESNYNRYIAYYYSDDLRIHALLLIPNSTRPNNGFPVIILNHGYIIPEKYTPDGNYIPYADAFARAGYIVFKPNYRGHGKSDGKPTSTYFSSNYIIDDLNAIASIKKYDLADPTKIGVWGHSMGGNITLKVAEISKDVKAVSVWSGVVAPIEEIVYHWKDKVTYKPDEEDLRLRNENLDYLLEKHGSPSANTVFWNSIDPNSFLTDIKIPVQIQVGLSDNQVPPSFSKGLYERLDNLGKNVEYFEYPDANHDINQSFDRAMENTIQFFDKYLK